jgi:hypothetical protein
MSPSALCSNLINRMQLPNLLAKVVDCKPFGRASSTFGIAAGMSLRSASQQLPVAKYEVSSRTRSGPLNAVGAIWFRNAVW